jgi:hypothetical protein
MIFSRRGIQMHITRRRRIGYSAIMGLGLVAVYTLIFPLPYTTFTDVLAVEALFAIGYVTGWVWLASRPEPPAVQVILDDRGMGHEVVETRSLTSAAH